ncbi:hypothetical protein C5B42_02785 [Candidatus Cerribacteria bacterium 'Amazon FNV 2010 28 9']|uniref:Uncharacterized protein n=1 Tax=Candidatus Cerribacteria bacterium 'Amazon FNV 2010 28 9' TaxID=2081795 RepID=A0A317JSV0_9BACT|nr:MAG: hypothetical protein C5B42_02785 [Candidatus Cerribacteria bacterium 'Amazon FNV 2010 28 9']
MTEFTFYGKGPLGKDSDVPPMLQSALDEAKKRLDDGRLKFGQKPDELGYEPGARGEKTTHITFYSGVEEQSKTDPEQYKNN